MINERSFCKDWITSQPGIAPHHYEIIEKVSHAFYLLELMSQQDFDYVFKGGSSLLLYFKDLHRFSVDIDILITPDQFKKLMRFIKDFKNERFFTVMEDKRKPNLLQKTHYKFYYKSLFQPDHQIPPYVLLDIVVDTIPFKKTMELPLELAFLSNDLPLSKAVVPSLEEMLGDKLTAFAPNTIGIRYVDQKYTEIIKQLYDCSRLSTSCQDYDSLIETYQEIGKREIHYRELKDKTVTDCLEDTLDTCKLLLSQGKTGNPVHYDLLGRGITGFSNFVIENFSLNDAVICAMNVYICCVIIKSGSSEKYQQLAIDFDAGEVKACFLSKGNVKLLRTLSGARYDDFLRAVSVENKLDQS